jgi:FSR family fosmidomycin resistance protein-like MFS transporter
MPARQWRSRPDRVIRHVEIQGRRRGCVANSGAGIALSAAQETTRPAPETPFSGPAARAAVETTTLAVLLGVSVSHMLNDMMQSLAPALYPVFRNEFGLTFFQTGLITFTFQATASLLQPVVGLYTDRRPLPFLLPIAMVFTFFGLGALAYGRSYATLLIAVGLIGVGSAIFHPEASRVARAASGGRFGLAQSLFQVGGNFGQSLGPLMAAFVVAPEGQSSVIWFTTLALLAVAILTRVSLWYGARRPAPRAVARAKTSGWPRPIVLRSLTILVILVFSKMFYMASISSYYTFYLIDTFHVSVRESQIYLFVFLGAVAAGTFAGGPIGDRFGRKFVIWFSILGVLPFTLLLPYANLFWTVVVSVAIGLVLSSAFSAIVVYGQELMPGNVGAIAGLFFGLAFGLGGLGAAVLGALADETSIGFVYRACSFLPAIGLLTYFLPDLRSHRP